MKPQILITGGAGFVGSNLAASLLRDDYSVAVMDALLRRGSEYNLSWLQQQNSGGRFKFIRGDVRNFDAVNEAVKDADVIYHFAAQVAVTSSVTDPRTDFECNALGTFNVLEAARRSGRRPIVVFTSTNKVYGNMEEVGTAECERRYVYSSLPYGVAESQPVDFHSPYGCSKGAADQYVQDYARIYDLPTVCFRMSCIYGPRQFGNEDQGWVAHFIIATITRRPVTIYGDGKQVRDILFIDDLVRAFRLAADNINVTGGNVYNIGGGPENTLSVWSEFGELLEELNGDTIDVTFSGWRPGDQPCYISDIRRARSDMGWQPLVSKEAGIRRLWNWVVSNPELFGPNVANARRAVEEPSTTFRG